MVFQPKQASITFHPLEQYQRSLSNFDENYGNRTNPISSVNSDDPLVDEFFKLVAATGRPHLSWDLIRRPFLWKLKTIINGALLSECEEQEDDLHRERLINNEQIKALREFVIEKAESFAGTPFTIQRLCELLTEPSRHYRTTEKLLRALERNINVVTTVTESGDRMTGADYFPSDEEDVESVPFEQNFIVSIDEVDEPLPWKMARLNSNECTDGAATHLFKEEN